MNIVSSELIQCRPAYFQVTGLDLPSRLMVLDASSLDLLHPLADLGSLDISDISQTWNVDAPGGTEIVFTAINGNGHQEFSNPMLISDSSDRSCLRTSSATTTSPLSPYVPARVMHIQGRDVPSTTTSPTPAQSSASSGSKVSGGLIGVFVAVIVAFAVIVFLTARWCVRTYRSESREVMEPGVSLREGADERLVDNTTRFSHASKRSSIAPTIYEGSYANVGLDDFVTIAPPTYKVPGKSNDEELGLLATSATSASSTHSTYSMPITPPTRKPSGPRNPPWPPHAITAGS